MLSSKCAGCSCSGRGKSSQLGSPKARRSSGFLILHHDIDKSASDSFPAVDETSHLPSLGCAHLHLPRRWPNHCWTHSGVPACEEERQVLQKPHKAAALDVGAWWLEGACTLQSRCGSERNSLLGGWPCWVRKGPFLAWLWALVVEELRCR